jgi:hypothetical protein
MTENAISERRFGYSRELFVSEATIGQTYAEKVAERLRAANIACYATELTFASTDEQIKEYENEQDIVFEHMDGCLEVKSRRLKFTDNPSSFPYPDAMVDTCSGWDKKNPKPFGVVMVSQLTDRMLVVPRSSEQNWVKKSAFDRVRQIKDVWYYANKTDMKTFDELCEFLFKRQEHYASA